MERDLREKPIFRFSDGSLEKYESFKIQWNIHHRMLCWDFHRARVEELYMCLEGKAALQVEEVVQGSNITMDVTKM